MDRYALQNDEAHAWKYLLMNPGAPDWAERRLEHKILLKNLTGIEEYISACSTKTSPTLEQVKYALQKHHDVPGRQMVILLLHKHVSVIHMTREEMCDFNLFVKAVRRIYPFFLQLDNFAWLHWVHVREICWGKFQS